MTDREAPQASETLRDSALETATPEAVDPEQGPIPPDGPSKPRSRGRSVGKFFRDVLLILLAAVVISFLIKTFLIRSFYIPSESMEPTLFVNDRIIVNQLVPDLTPIEHGDVVVFKDPGGWLTPTPEPEQNPIVGFFDWLLSIVGLTAPDSDDHLIKRVIGLPGDTVTCCNEFGQLSVNGIPLEEPYVQLPDGVTKVSSDDFEVTVPEEALWVMGDNRYNSADSRYNLDNPGNGFVPFDNVVGRAILISWPIGRWIWLDNYPVVFSGVDGGERSPDDTAEEPEPESHR